MGGMGGEYGVKGPGVFLFPRGADGCRRRGKGQGPKQKDRPCI